MAHYLDVRLSVMRVLPSIRPLAFTGPWSIIREGEVEVLRMLTFQFVFANLRQPKSLVDPMRSHPSIKLSFPLRTILTSLKLAASPDKQPPLFAISQSESTDPINSSSPKPHRDLTILAKADNGVVRASFFLVRQVA